MLWRWSASNKTERGKTLASSLQMTPPFLPPSSSGHWMPPHWSPPRPWLPAGVPLTSDPWPPAPQNSSQRRRLSSPSGEHILWAAAMTTEGSDSEYRCYRCSLRRLLLFLLFIFTTHCTRSHKVLNTVFQALNLWLWVFSRHGRSHLSWCSRVRKEDPAVPWWKAARYREIWLQECSAFILIEETCACSVHLHWENVTLFSHLCTGIKVLTS